LNNELELVIRQLIIRAGQLNQQPHELSLDDHLVYQHNFDSLKIQVLLMELEKELEIAIPEDHYSLNYFHSIIGILMYIENGLYNV
jgi:acyl carrier protein